MHDFPVQRRYARMKAQEKIGQEYRRTHRKEIQQKGLAGLAPPKREHSPDGGKKKEGVFQGDLQADKITGIIEQSVPDVGWRKGPVFVKVPAFGNVTEGYPVVLPIPDDDGELMQTRVMARASQGPRRRN